MESKIAQKAKEYSDKLYPKARKGDEKTHPVSSFKAKNNCFDDFVAGAEWMLSEICNKTFEK